MTQEYVDMEAQGAAEPMGQTKDPSIFKNANRPVILKFEDVVYKIKSKSGATDQKNSNPEERAILKGITGMVRPGELLALLGPSGSGKTTFLSALGGRLGGDLSGSITFNGKPFSNAMKNNTGFVTQDDVLFAELTVEETLIFTALLRLPNSLSKQEKILQAEAVISNLGLTKCKNSIIGGPFVRGVSGGERKRVSIGQEMLINPSLLFLDEPTSGLDSTTAQKIVSTLWDLANGGRTIVMTIHQPSSRLFYMFHKLLLLSDGNPLYFGKGSEALDYFARIGYTPEVPMNPSDFLLDLANGIWGAEASSEYQVETKRSLASAFKTHIEGNLKAELKNCGGHFDEVEEDKHVMIRRWQISWWEQFSVLFRRGLKQRKSESFSKLRIGQVLVIAFLCGLLWWRSDTSHLQDQIGLLFFYAGFWSAFPLFQAIFTFPEERRMLAKERSSGMYRLSSFFLSRIGTDLPMELVLPIIFIIITYWMAGLKPTPVSFFITALVVLLCVMASSGLGLAIGALVLNQKSAATLASVLLLTFQLGGGFFVQHTPGFIAWVKYISIITYTYKLLLGAQYTAGQTYACGENRSCLVEDFPSIKSIGLGGQAVCVVALLIMIVGYRFIAYLALMRIGAVRK